VVKWIALFRGINVGGNNILPMKPLTQTLSDLGCKEVQTYIQSGNVILRHHESDVAVLGTLIAN
jgi:uncharacterized protein (DUF1697 family)